MQTSFPIMTTMDPPPGYAVDRVLGACWGITVRSRSVVGNFVGGIETLFGGRINTYVELCENAREEAYDLLIEHAGQIGANAIIGVHYDATEVMDGVTEVLAYGTAVMLEKL